MPAITVAMRTEISQLYVSLFGRAPDGEGLGFWTKSYSDGNTIAKIAQSMYDTSPARAYYPLFATPSEVVTTFYTNVLGRAPDAEGLAFWVKEYNASATQGAFFEKLIGNVVNYNGTDAAGITSKSLFTNKVSVAQYYGEQNGTVAGATSALNGVTSVATTVDTAKAAILNTAVTGQTFTLTTSIDSGATFTGGANQDAFNATHLTFGASDVLVGGAGTDTLTIVDTGTAAFTLPAASVSGIENINIRNLNGATAVTGVSEAATIQFRDLLEGHTISIAGVTFTAGTGGATAANVAAAFTTGTITATNAAVTGGVLTDTATGTAANADTRAEVTALLLAGGYSVAAGTAITNSVVATASGTAGPVVDLAPTGNAMTGRSQVTTLTITNASTTANNVTTTFTYNGVTLTAAAGATDAVAAFATTITAAINAYAGANIAVAGATTVTVTSPTAVQLAGFASTGNTFAYALTTGLLAAAAPTVTIVQGVTAVTASGLTDTVDATKFTDATTIASDGSTGLVNITGLTAAQTAVKKAGAGGLGAGFGATVTAGTVEINGGSTAGAVDITGTVFTTLTLNSTGAANTIGALTGKATTTTSTTINATTNLTTGAATNLGATVTVNGAGNVTLGVATSSSTGVVTATALESGVTTLNAAGLTGALTVALGSAVTQKVTGGSGNDVILTGAVLTTGSVDAGAGSADVLALTSGTHLASATLAAKYTNFETLRLDTGITQDMGNAPASITAVQTMGVATVSNMTPAQAAAVQMRTNATAGTADALNFSLASAAGTADVLTIVAGVGTTVQGALDIAALTVTGFETLNLQANPGPSSTAGDGAAGDRTTNITGTITGATLRTVNLTGTAVNIANVAVANATAGVTINGSALTGDGLAAASQAGLTVAGSAFAGSTITGSGVRDVFTIGAEGSAYNGGAGNDRMTTTVAILVADGVTDGTMNGGDNTDTLVVSDTTTTLTDNHFVKLSNFEALTLSNTVGDASVTTGGSFNTAFATGATIVTGKLAVTKDVAFLGGLATVPITLTVDLDLVTGAATDVQTIVTGSAADTVTLTGDATYVGVNGAADQGTINISTGAGDDTISYTHGQLLANGRDGVTSAAFQAVIITGGSGADTITKGTGSLNSTTVASVTYFNMAAGDSGTTIATQDKITGLSMAGVATNSLSDVLNFEGTATVSTFSNSIDFGSILTHSLTGGIATFDTASTFASAKIVNATNLADVVGYLNANMGVNQTVGFLFDSNGDGANDATMVFHQGSSLTTVADDLVQLVGTIGLSLNATLTTVTAGAIAIA